MKKVVEFDSILLSTISDKNGVFFVRDFNTEKDFDSASLLNEIDIPKELINSHPRRKVSFKAGRYCLKKCCQNLGLEYTTFSYQSNKPPIGPPGYFCSISHCNTLAMSAMVPISNSSGIGVDVQKFVETKSFQAINNKVLTDDEKSKIMTLCNTEITTKKTLTLAFSAKESVYKAFFPIVNNYFGFDAAELVDISKNSVAVRLTKNFPLKSFRNTFQKLSYHFTKEYVFTAICLEKY